MPSALEQLRKIREKKHVEQPISQEMPEESPTPKMGLYEALAVFGHKEFRPGQEEVIQAVLDDSEGVLAVFPTGHGKSLAYQLPSLMSDKLTVVVSPLIALMKDQVDALQKLGVNAILINSTLSEQETKLALAEVSSGGVTALYVSPERFGNPQFNRTIEKLDIDIFAVDEAHCISRWGHDFRPSYAQLGGVIERFNPRQVVALTATATQKVRDDICQILGIPDAKKFVRGVYRKNLTLAAMEATGIERLEQIALIAKEHRDLGGNTGIIYTATKKESESICQFLKERGIDATFYHAGLKTTERSDIQNNWAGDGGVIVATCAFGMGIDKADVRFVIHSGLSQSIEDWYQEIGRAGRDGEDSLCITFYDYRGDYRTQMFLIDLTNPSGKDIEIFWSWIKQAARKVAKDDEKTVELKMTQKVMAAESGCVNVGGCIAFLKKKGLVKTLGRGRYEVAKDGEFDSSDVDVLRQERIDKLNEVVNFYRSKECRAAYICGYFGDDTFEGSCGICDNCG